MNKGQKLHRFAIMMDKWASPVFIEAYSALNAVKKAEQLFPVCDCSCGEKANVTDVKYLR